jgi:metal-sulfur cluster biosynthetic enzyme
VTPPAAPRLASVWDALRTVIDPEVGLDVVTMGLVYDVALDGGTARVTYSLTTPGCPMERIITDGIREAVGYVDGVRTVDTRLVWDPEWDAGMIAPGAWDPPAAG